MYTCVSGHLYYIRFRIHGSGTVDWLRNYFIYLLVFNIMLYLFTLIFVE